MTTTLTTPTRETVATTRTPQDDSQSTYAEMLHKGLSRVDWSRPAKAVHDLVRGLSPWPVASTTYHGKGLKIHKTALMPSAQQLSGKPGDMLEQDGRVFVCCGEGAVELLTVQYEGGKRMAARDFFRGHPLHEAEHLA